MTRPETRFIRESRQAVRDARAARLIAEAQSLTEQADRIAATQNRDPAFSTQPVQNNAAGRAFARQREASRQKFDKEMRIRSEAAGLASEAAHLQATPVRVKGDAAAEKSAAAAALDVRVGDIAHTIYGARRVVKVNAKSILIDGALSPIKVEKHLVSHVTRADP